MDAPNNAPTMTTDQAKALANYISNWSSGCPHGLHLQDNAEARLAFLDKNVPDERKMLKFYCVGELNLRRIVQCVAERSDVDLVEMQNQFDAEMAKYRARVNELIDEQYGVYVRCLMKHNTDAIKGYDRRKKVKSIMTRSEFVATLPVI